MKTLGTLSKNVRHAAALSRTISVVAVVAVLTCIPFLFAQAQDNWPIPSVALYDCNTSAASGADSSQQAALNSASKLIFQDIVSDTSTREVFLISFGFADTTSSDFSSAAGYFPLPDSSDTSADVLDYDFVIGSKITGSSGSYTLTVSIENGQSYAHVADGVDIDWLRNQQQCQGSLLICRPANSSACHGDPCLRGEIEGCKSVAND